MSRFRSTLSDSPTPSEAPSFVSAGPQTPPLSSSPSSSPLAPPPPPPPPEPNHSTTSTPPIEAGILEDSNAPVPTLREKEDAGQSRKGSLNDPFPKFHSAVARLSALHRVSGASNKTTDAAYDWGSSGMGAEPGLDPQKATLDDMKGPTKVQVVDWSADKVIQRRFEDGEDFLRWFNQEERKDWVKARWINIDGLNWEVAKAIALRFELHPLALEDALKVAAHSHSKVDWYPTQLFTRVLIHSLSPPVSSHGLKPPHSSGPFHTLLKALGMNRTSRHARDVLAGDLENAGTFLSKSKKSTDEGSVGLVLTDDDSDDSSDEGEKARDKRLEEQLAARAVVESLTEKFKVPVDKQQLSTFLLPSGTIISFFTRSGESLTSSIFQRLDTPGTLLRSTEDCSMLLQALLDVVVDEVLELTEEFRRELDVLEGRALVNPDTTAVRHLHVLSGQLLMLKRTLTPLQGMMVSLRHDDEKRTTVARRSASTSSGSTIPEGEHPGFLSSSAKLYLSDVNDHIDSVLTSLSLFSKIADSIVDFIFNSLSFASNESMKWLTMFSIVFLPLSFLVGYYGMNFSVFPDIGLFPEGTDPYGPNPQGGLSYFWTITGPVIAVLVGLLFVMNFGSWVIGVGRRLLHRAERHKHRKIIRAVRKTRRKQKMA